MKIIGYGLLVLLLMSGCVRRVQIPVDTVTSDQETIEEQKPRPTGKLYDTTRTEAKYNLKPEPYSIGSNQVDPELLGPQKTISETPAVNDTPKIAEQKSDTSKTVVATESSAQPEVTTKTSISSMSKSECISMIGANKFERYSKRFGGETGAIKRCAILKKLGRG